MSELPRPLTDNEQPDGWELAEDGATDSARSYHNDELGLFVYVYADEQLASDSDPVVGDRVWGINLERRHDNPNHVRNGGDKEQQVAATSVQNASVGSAEDCANLHAVVRGYMELAERLASE